MQLFSFAPNTAIRLFNTLYTVQAVEDNKTVILRAENGSTRTWELDVLLAHHRTGNLRAAPNQQTRHPSTRTARRHVPDASPKAKADAVRCVTYLKAIKEAGLRLRANQPALAQLLRDTSQTLADGKPPHLSTLKRWLRADRRSGGDPVAQIPRYDLRGGRFKMRAATEVQQVVHAVIDNHYLTPTGNSAAQAYSVLMAKLEEANQWRPSSQALCIPSYSTFLRQIKLRPGYEVMAAREGARAANLHYRATGRSTEMHAFNRCWEVDHTVLDLFVVDTEGRATPGRPRLSIMIETVSRMPVGFDIGLDGNSTISVLNCLRHAILPKDYVKGQYPEVQGTWPAMGVPSILKCDNGKEFHAESLKDACFELGIELQYCPARSPWHKGRVERFFGTLTRGLLRGLPGASRAHFYERKEGQDPASQAVIDMKTLKRLLHIWLIDVYMNTDHKGLQ